MKENLNKLRFVLRYALKNVCYHPMRSLLIVIGFLALTTSLLLGSSLTSFFNVYFYGELEERYGTSDIKMSASPLSDARFFSTRDLNNDLLGDIIVDYIPFFEIDVLVETQTDEKFYVHLFSSTLTQFRKISNQNQITHHVLSQNEVIITESMAYTYHLSLNDELTLYSKDLTRTYQIVEIVEDGKLFKDNAIYLDKSSSFNFFLESLNPSYASLNPSSLVNIHNTVYIDIADDVTFDEAVSLITTISSYEHLTYDQLIDPAFVNETINRNISAFNMIISVVILAVVLVLYTTLLTYFDDKRKMFAVIETLGGKKSFSYSIILVEMFIYFISSFILSILASNFMIAYGIKVLNSPVNYTIPLRYMLLVATSILLVFMTTSFIFFYQFNKNAAIQQTKDSGHEVSFRLSTSGLIALLSLTLYFVLEINQVALYLSFTKSLYQVILSIIFMLSSGFFITKLVIRMLHIKKNPFILSLHLKTLFSKRALYQYISVLLISCLSIYLIIAINGYMVVRQRDYENQYNLDLVVTNIINDYEITYQEISNLEEVGIVSKVGLFQDVTINELDDAIHDFVSMDSSHISYYFNLDISEEALSRLNSDYPVILLPNSYRYLHLMKIGDSISINMGSYGQEIHFIIGGFFEKQLNNLAFSNLSFVDEENFGVNSLFVNAKEDKLELNDLLLDLYSSKLIYIIDYNYFVARLVNDMQQITSYLNTIIFVILFCFVLSIVNHSYLLFNQMKSVYSRLFVLGYSIRKMQTYHAFESLIILLMLLSISSLTYIMIGTKLNQFILFFGSYEPIHFDSSSLWIGLIFITMLYIITKSFYMIKLGKIHPQDVLKTF